MILIVVAAYASLHLSEFKAKCVVVALTALCWIATYLWFCATNEFVYLSFAFTAVGIYNFVNNIQAFIVGGLSFRNIIRRRNLIDRYDNVLIAKSYMITGRDKRRRTSIE